MEILQQQKKTVKHEEKSFYFAAFQEYTCTAEKIKSFVCFFAYFFLDI